MSGFVRVGQIVGTHGLKGQVKVDLLTDFPERLAIGRRLRLEGEWVEVTDLLWHKNRPILRLDGVRSIEAAEALKWKFLEAAEDDLDLEEDEFMIKDLLGLEVFEESGRRLGEVEDVLPYPAQDLLKVGELLIPLVKEFVLDVDLDAGRVTVRLLEGMEGEAD